MHRADGAGVSIVGHARNLAQVRLVQPCIGENHAECGVADKLFRLRLDCLQGRQLGIEEGFSVRCQQARDFTAVLIIVNVPHGIDGHHSADLQIPHLNGIAADAGLHAVLHTQQLADGSAGARAVVAVTVVARLRVDTGLVGHSRIGAGVRIGHCQVKQIRLADQRNPCDTHINANAALLQIAHHAARGVQPKGTAARQQNGVNDLRGGQWLEQLTLPRGRPTAADIQPDGCALPA